MGEGHEVVGGDDFREQSVAPVGLLDALVDMVHVKFEVEKSLRVGEVFGAEGSHVRLGEKVVLALKFGYDVPTK
jgi:hypothetical protein